MKIHLAILESDHAYMKRIVSVFNIKYADKLEIYSFTNESNAMQSLKEAKIDVFLAGDTFEIDVEKIPPRCGFAYLVDAPDVESIYGQEAICKFQKAELIYKHILNIFSEKTAAVTGISADENQGTKVLAFVSAAGGTGSSTAAASCAMHFAKKGKKTLYLNLEQFGSADVFFQGEGQGNFGDIIYNIKSKKGNLYLKLESTVKQDATGVFFFSESPVALDMLELNDKEVKQILTELKTYCDYEYVVADFDFAIREELLSVLEECYQVIFVADGAEASNRKLERVINSLDILEKQQDENQFLHMGILYNRFSSRTSSKIEHKEWKEFGGIKRYEGFQAQQLMKELSELDVFEAMA